MIDVEIYRAVRRIEIDVRRAISRAAAGQRRIGGRGRGLAFEDVRVYQPGDDIRAIDWKVTARRAEPFIKRFVEERQQTTWLVLDDTASMDFGATDRNKRKAAINAAALLGLWTTLRGDRVGLVTFGRHARVVEPASRDVHALRIVRELLCPVSGRDIPLAEQIGRLSRNAKSRALVFVISDFLYEEPIDQFDPLRQRHELFLIHISDPLERQIPKVGLVRLRDAETGRVRLIDSSSARFREAFSQHELWRRRDLRRQARQRGIEWVELDAATSIAGQMLWRFRAKELLRPP